MRITSVLCTASRRRPGGARGAKTRGKHQEPHLIREAERRKFVENLLVECTNEMWLTRPFLNEKQEKLLTEKLKKSSKGNPLVRTDTKLSHDHCNLRYRINMPQHVSFEERWSPLKELRQWVPVDKDIHRRKTCEKYARAVIPKRYPDFYPRYQEKWDEWSKVEGFGLSEKMSSLSLETSTVNKKDEP